VRLILIFLLGCLLSAPALTAQLPSEAQLRQDLQQAEANKSQPNQADIVKELQSALRMVVYSKVKEGVKSTRISPTKQIISS